MLDWASLGREAIAGEHPAGQDARYEPEYELMQDELRKLTAMTGGVPDWKVIAEAAVTLLRHKSKDISAATYLAIAAGNLEGFVAWSQGTGVLADLLDCWWDTAFPPLKRIKARMNSLEWWQERSLGLLEAWKDASPVPQTVLVQAKEDVRRLDALIGERMPDFPALRQVLEAIDALPQLAMPEPVEDKAAPSAISEPVVAPSSPSPVAATPVASSTPISTISLGPEADSATALSALQHFAGDVANILGCATPLPTEALLWKVFFADLLGRIVQLPPADGGQTAITPPDAAVLENAEKLLHSGQAEQVVRALLRFIPASPLWLTLPYTLTQALTALGTEYAGVATVIQWEYAAFAARLEGIGTLAFDGGMPFATSAAQAWLSVGGTAAMVPSSVDTVEERVRAAAREMSEGHMAAALSMLESAPVAHGGRDAMRLRLAQVQLCCQQQQWSLAEGLLQELLDAVAHFHLEEWDAPLAFAVWSAEYHLAARLMDGQNSARMAEALRHASRLDPVGALRLLS